jgi:hypothetical protein
MIEGLLKHAAFLIVPFGCAIGATAASNVRVEFVKPDNYTDVSFRSMTPESARERLIGELSRTIQDSAAKPLAGYELYVRILDVHMAGRHSKRPELTPICAFVTELPRQRFLFNT